MSQSSSPNEAVAKYLYEDLGLKKYWRGSNHEETVDSNILNLWRITESEKEVFSRRVEEYFKSTSFAGKDLSVVSLSLVEAFWNIFDHADAKGNAFCQVFYDDSKQSLSIAVSDFGIGLANTVKNFDKSIKTDECAIKRAIEDDFTIASTPHNRGKGLSNILFSSTSARIVSGSGLLVKVSDSIKTYILNYSFPGTLIYYDIDLSSMEEEDFLDDFNF